MDRNNRRFSSDEFADRQLIELLRDEALADRPEFSPAMHDRLAGSVGRLAAQRRAAQAARRTRLRLATWGTAAVAASVAVLLASQWRFTDRRDAGPLTNGSRAALVAASSPHAVAPMASAKPVDSSDSADDFGELAMMADRTGDEIQSWVADTAEEQQWGGLDRGLRSAVQAFAGPLPIEIVLSLVEDNP